MVPSSTDKAPTRVGALFNHRFGSHAVTVSQDKVCHQHLLVLFDPNIVDPNPLILDTVVGREREFNIDVAFALA